MKRVLFFFIFKASLIWGQEILSFEEDLENIFHASRWVRQSQEKPLENEFLLYKDLLFQYIQSGKLWHAQKLIEKIEKKPLLPASLETWHTLVWGWAILQQDPRALQICEYYLSQKKEPWIPLCLGLLGESWVPQEMRKRWSQSFLWDNYPLFYQEAMALSFLKNQEISFFEDFFQRHPQVKKTLTYALYLTHKNLIKESSLHLSLKKEGFFQQWYQARMYYEEKKYQEAFFHYQKLLEFSSPLWKNIHEEWSVLKEDNVIKNKDDVFSQKGLMDSFLKKKAYSNYDIKWTQDKLINFKDLKMTPSLWFQFSQMAMSYQLKNEMTSTALSILLIYEKEKILKQKALNLLEPLWRLEKEDLFLKQDKNLKLIHEYGFRLLENMKGVLNLKRGKIPEKVFQEYERILRQLHEKKRETSLTMEHQKQMMVQISEKIKEIFLKQEDLKASLAGISYWHYQKNEAHFEILLMQMQQFEKNLFDVLGEFLMPQEKKQSPMEIYISHQYKEILSFWMILLEVNKDLEKDLKLKDWSKKNHDVIMFFQSWVKEIYDSHLESFYDLKNMWKIWKNNENAFWAFLENHRELKSLFYQSLQSLEKKQYEYQDELLNKEAKIYQEHILEHQRVLEELHEKQKERERWFELSRKYYSYGLYP